MKKLTQEEQERKNTLLATNINVVDAEIIDFEDAMNDAVSYEEAGMLDDLPNNDISVGDSMDTLQRKIFFAGEFSFC